MGVVQTHDRAQEEIEPSEKTAVEAAVSFMQNKVAEMEAEAERGLEEFGADRCAALCGHPRIPCATRLVQ